MGEINAKCKSNCTFSAFELMSTLWKRWKCVKNKTSRITTECQLPTHFLPYTNDRIFLNVNSMTWVHHQPEILLPFPRSPNKYIILSTIKYPLESSPINEKIQFLHSFENIQFEKFEWYSLKESMDIKNSCGNQARRDGKKPLLCRLWTFNYSPSL